MEKTREQLMAEARGMQLMDLYDLVMSGSYTRGVHDVVLRELVKGLSPAENK